MESTATKHLFLCIVVYCLSIHCYSLSNQWNETTGAYGEDIWYSTTDFVPVQSQSFGSIRIGRIMTMEFDFIFGGRTNDPSIGLSEMFFRIGFDSTDGTSCDAQNSRYPSFWLDADSDTVFVSASDTISCYNYYDLKQYGIITIGISYHIFIEFNDTTLRIEASGGDKPPWSQSWHRSATTPSHLGEEVSVWWMSGKFGSSTYNRANGTFSNITITSKWFTLNTSSPSVPPTIAPTAEILSIVTGTESMEWIDSTSSSTASTLFAEDESDELMETTVSVSRLSTSTLNMSTSTMNSKVTESQSVVYDNGSVWNPHFSDIGIILLVTALVVVLCCVMVICSFICIMRRQMKALDEEMKLSKTMRSMHSMQSGSVHGSFSPSHTLSPWSPDHEFIHQMQHHKLVKEFSPSPVHNIADRTPTTMTSLVTHEYPSNGVGSPYFRRNTMGTRPPMDVLPATSTTSPRDSGVSASSTNSTTLSSSDTGTVLDGLETMYGAYSPSQDQGKYIEGTGDREEVSV